MSGIGAIVPIILISGAAGALTASSFSGLKMSTLNVQLYWQYMILIMLVVAPLITLGYGAVIQTKCKSIDAFGLVKTAYAIVPAIFFIIGLSVWISEGSAFPLRWPVEGLFQVRSEQTRYILSTVFFVFWASLYSQTMVGGSAQICPEAPPKPATQPTTPPTNPPAA